MSLNHIRGMRAPVALCIVVTMVFCTSFTIFGAGHTGSKEADPGRCIEILKLGKRVAAEGDTINFYGFFPGMSRHDAQALAVFYGLDGDGCCVHADGEKGVCSITLNIKAVSRILKMMKIKGQTYEEIAQAIANAVGDMRSVTQTDRLGYTHEWAERKLINGCRLIVSEDGMRIEGSDDTRANMPIETTEAKEQRIRAEKAVIPDILANMVDIPLKSSNMKPFKIGKYEVTQLQWVHIMGKNPSNHMSARIGSSNSGDCPVDNVSWNDCQEFFKEFNALPEVKKTGLIFRLPTAEEWEYACRAGAVEGVCKLVDGTEIAKRKITDVAWIDAGYQTKPVGMKTPNAFGIFDMIGNVSEWTLSSENENDYVYMGGDCESEWEDKSSKNLWRKCANPKYTSSECGFRLCASKFKPQLPSKACKPSHDNKPNIDEKTPSRRESRGRRGNSNAVSTPEESDSGQRPKAKVASKTSTTQVTLNTETDTTVASLAPVSISEKDKKLKERVMALCRLPPDFSAAGKWFNLAKEIESNELRQFALKASGAALLYVQNANVYNSRVKPLIKESSSFEKSFYVRCSSCNGEKTIDKNCTACGGSGVCKYSNCRNGQHLVHNIGGDYYEKCRDCKGSGECQKCGTTGKRKVKCFRCNGRGVVYSRDAALETYHGCVEAISQSFQ